MNYQILVADDEKEIRELLRLYLEKEGYHVLEAENGEQALQLLKTNPIDLVLLDIMMPKLNGYQVMKAIRETKNIPILILSAKGQSCDKILGLDLGADDYIAKPFDPLEVLSRMNAQLRRFYQLNERVPPAPSVLTVGDLSLDLEQCVLTCQGEVIPINATEFRIMKLFLSSPGKVFTKQQIFEAGWNEFVIIDDNSLMVCISKLRSKLEKGTGEYIKTIRGLGYRLEKPL